MEVHAQSMYEPCKVVGSKRGASNEVGINDGGECKAPVKGNLETRRKETRTQFYVHKMLMINKFIESVTLPLGSMVPSVGNGIGGNVGD
jgi:hypothetical protein